MSCQRIRSREPWDNSNYGGGGAEMARLRIDRPECGVREIKGIEKFRNLVWSPALKSSAWSAGRDWRKGH